MSLTVRFIMLVALLQAACIYRVDASDYLRDVKPLLEHKCYACHGALKQQGGLRLDTAVSLLKGGDSGSPVSVDEPEESLLLGVLTGDAGFRMPPENQGAALSKDEIDLIRGWISKGAPLPEEESPQTDPRSWWSYQPIRRPAVPSVKEGSWCRNDIDRFVAAAREREGLPVVREATKPVWLRRVYLDLIGLPPTREELHRFLADDSADAYERVVDDLLARPQYGERWGRHWMDVWRYSDWYGSRGINEIRYSQRHIWRWRDWIVASLNEDKGYDQMIREMLAGDEIAGGDVSVFPATGYLGRNWYKFDRNVWLFDTVERTGEAFLGLTLRCCRCHDHKFDPIRQEEYYRFRAFFEPHDVRTDPVSAMTGTQKDSKLGAVLKDGIPLVYDKDLEAVTYRFERGDGRYPDKTKALAPGVPEALGGTVDIHPVELPAETWYPMLRPELRQSLIEKADAGIATAEANLKSARAAAEKASEQLAAAERKGGETAGKAEVFFEDTFEKARPDDWKVVNGGWVWRDGKLVEPDVTSFATIVTKAQLPPDVGIHLRYRPLAAGTYRSIGFSFDYVDKGNCQDVYTSTNDKRQTVQAFHRVGGKQMYPREGIVPAMLAVGEEAVLDVSIVGSQLTIDLNGERKLEYTLPVKRRPGKFALWVHQGAAEFLELKITKLAESVETLKIRQADAERAAGVSQAKLELARGEADSVRKRVAADVKRYIERDENSSEELARDALKAELAVEVLKARVQVAEAGESKRAEAEKALAAAEEKASAMEGSYSAVGEQYPRTSTGRRKALADWIASAENPRTARVAANHIWGRHLGQPLVATPENFGLNGRQPTHPELLDWLAAELMAGGWKMKSLHKEIVLSSTYRMTSLPAFGDETESNGREAVRERLGTAMKVDPENHFLWRMNARRMEAEVVRDSVLYLSGRLDLSRGGPEIPETEGEKVLRRSLYFRNTPNEKMLMMEIFDVADPNGCYRRKESIVPHQSLAMMNSGLMLDSARALGELLSKESDFVTAAFETVLSRAPTPAEVSRCREFLAEQAAFLKGESKEPFTGGGSAKRAAAADPAVRAKENLIHVLFLHNDFVTIR